MPQRQRRDNCSWAWRLIYRSTSVELNLRGRAAVCLVEPLHSFGFQSCTAYAAKQWREGRHRGAGKHKAQVFACWLCKYGHGQQNVQDGEWCLCVCVIQMSPRSDAPLITSTSKHLLMEEKLINKWYERREKCQTPVSSQEPAKAERLGPCFDELSEGKQLRAANWEAFVKEPLRPFVVSFLLLLQRAGMQMSPLIPHV